ncbi:hypothetical protein G7047_10485 [Diaphorobacter sp. HDW4A]|uniref:DUF5979 domain-containing protein n=1 Tax=Diaphorobacter sp. HDW4A TaxID=2714924 RepID=UPI0014085B90|nr:DUF5979 domain-containing protein [Diaphorobacter sp. HDW4A]QIL80281.1 hypothetical protein G7047_10485 [Diaphorobacter sp. HDW4A]
MAPISNQNEMAHQVANIRISDKASYAPLARRLSRGIWVLAAGVVWASTSGITHAQTTAPIKHVLLIGDTSTYSPIGPTNTDNRSLDYFNAAKAQLSAVSNVQLDTIEHLEPLDATHNPSPTSLTPAQLRMGDGSKYDAIIVMATYKGIEAGNRAVIEQSIINGDAKSFFLFPDECSSCASNVQDISVPWVNAITNWNVSAGISPGNNNVSSYADLNTSPAAQSLSSSFGSVNPLFVWDYKAINGVPEANVLYMPREYPLASSTQNGIVNNVAALIVPRSPTEAHACVFVISDVNTWYVGANQTVTNPNLAGALIDAANSASCSGGLEGAIQIQKTLTLPAGQAGPIHAQFFATCDKPQAGSVFASTSTALNAGTQNITISNLPDGAQCTISEQMDAAPAGFQWTQTLPTSPATVIAAQTVNVAVTNVLTPIAPATGSIRVNKTMALSGQIASTTMRFKATCDLPNAASSYESSDLVMQIDGTQSTDITSIPAGAQCTVSETLSAPPTGFYWQQNVPTTPVSVSAGTAVPFDITNTLQPLASNTGAIRVIKNLTVPAEVTSSFDLRFSADCGSAVYASAPLTMTGNGQQWVDIPNVPVGAQCTVSETLPTAPINYAWLIVPNQSATVTDPKTGTVSVTFNNQLTRGSGTIRIQKQLVVPTGVQGPFAMQFSANCSNVAAQPPPVTLTMSASGAQSVDMPGVPAGATCAISEQLPSAPVGMAWAVPGITPQSVTVPDNASVVVDVANEMKVSPPVVTDPPSPTPVPSLGPLALGGLSMALAGLGALRQRRQRITAARQGPR